MSDRQALVCMQSVQSHAVASAEGGTDAAALEAVAQLPPLVLQALAHVLDYVRPLKMDAVLRLGASFKEFHGVHQMSLSPNALRWLHFLHCKACDQCLNATKPALSFTRFRTVDTGHSP